MENESGIAALAALAQETGLDLFRMLVRSGPSGLAAGALAEALEVPPATLSFHLKELRAAGIARCRREGRSLIYSPNFAVVEDLVAFLTENCCEGSSTD